MDYGAITSCETEYNKAVCLCGSHECRQSFMMFTGTRALDEVLRGFGPLMIFKTLIQVRVDGNKKEIFAKEEKKCGLTRVEMKLKEEAMFALLLTSSHFVLPYWFFWGFFLLSK